MELKFPWQCALSARSEENLGVGRDSGQVVVSG